MAPGAVLVQGRAYGLRWPGSGGAIPRRGCRRRGLVAAWGYNGAFGLAGGISLFAGVVALFLTPPGRPRGKKVTPNPRPLGEG